MLHDDYNKKIDKFVINLSNTRMVQIIPKGKNNFDLHDNIVWLSCIERLK